MNARPSLDQPVEFVTSTKTGLAAWKFGEAQARSVMIVVVKVNKEK